MFDSLRNRLWISFLFVTGSALCVMSLAFVWAIQRTPFFDRQVFSRLQLLGDTMGSQDGLKTSQDFERIYQNYSAQAETLQLRMVVFVQDGAIIFDSEPDAENIIPFIQQDSSEPGDMAINIPSFRDSSRREWLYDITGLNDETYVLLAAPRPGFRLRLILRDEVLSSFILALIAAAVLAFLVSLLMATNISYPLRRISSSAKKLAQGGYETIHPEGPWEVRQLAKTFNEMVSRLDANQQAQRDFIGNVSHELKTPLTSIQGFAGAILDGTANTAESLRQAAQIIYDETLRMHHLVMDLLSLTRLESMTSQCQMATVGLSQLIHTVSQKFEVIFNQNSLKLNIDFQEEIECLGDAELISQVFANLLDNAIKFSPAGSTISIRGQRRDTWAEVQVIDLGIGISQDDQKRIFERFFQVDRSRKGGQARGVGLGLSIVKQIVERHGGEIYVQSEPGKGSTFVVRLPISSRR